MGDMKRKSATGKEIETEVSGINLDRMIREGLSAKAVFFPPEYKLQETHTYRQYTPPCCLIKK